MKKKCRKIEKIQEIIYNILHSEAFREKYRMQKNDFTRNRKLKFTEVCLLVLKGSKRGLQAGINDFLKEIKSSVDTYSKAAFCNARQKINPEAFRMLFQTTVDGFYADKDYKTYRDYRICAIDGTDFNLPNTEELLDIYGSEPYNHCTQVQAQVSCLYDVLNHILIDVQMEPYNTNERALAEKHLEELKKRETEKELVLMDRGYPSEKLLVKLEENKFKYIMRSNKNEFFREVRDVKSQDEIITRKCKEGVLSIRVVSVPLDDGKIETLLTNIVDDDFSIKDFAEIYHLRWGIESKYNDIKNKLQIENFSGITPISILQDFYATMFLSNIAAVLEFDCTHELNQINASDELRYQYKLNVNMTIAILKSTVVALLLTDSKRKQNQLFKRIKTQLMQCLVPIRVGRQFPRKVKHPAIVFPSNYKSV